MSRSRKDGRKGGGHRNTQGREVWSSRPCKIPMADVHDPDYKRLTHRAERRSARETIARILRTIRDGWRLPARAFDVDPLEGARDE